MLPVGSSIGIDAVVASDLLQGATANSARGFGSEAVVRNKALPQEVWSMPCWLGPLSHESSISAQQLLFPRLPGCRRARSLPAALPASPLPLPITGRSRCCMMMYTQKAHVKVLDLESQGLSQAAALIGVARATVESRSCRF